ncbi:MAG TPA: RecX family transcriptional regulator [Acetobacteraceae bacterium]|jgi:regulatory protein|nr:RecX family transcriptional regulator [Acetobacteraceae bacterium]
MTDEDSTHGKGNRRQRTRRPAPPTPGPPPPGPLPTEALLHEAALNHLARFAATETGLRRVLERRVDRWARRSESAGEPPDAIAAHAAEAKRQAAAVARKLVSSGAVDDAAFAAARARRLSRSGRSRRAIAAHLAAKGVARGTADAALPDGEDAELDSALAFCRRRRTGPFAPEGLSQEARRKALAALARAGFSRSVAETALDSAPGDAEARLAALRQS